MELSGCGAVEGAPAPQGHGVGATGAQAHLRGGEGRGAAGALANLQGRTAGVAFRFGAGGALCELQSAAGCTVEYSSAE